MLVENLDYKKMRDDEGTRPEMFLRCGWGAQGWVSTAHLQCESGAEATPIERCFGDAEEGHVMF